MIKPTIGRVVWYWPEYAKPIQARAAIITYVSTDTMVNLVAFTPEGLAQSKLAVTLYQGEGERPERDFCEWMPYQIGQGKKHEVEASDPTYKAIFS